MARDRDDGRDGSSGGIVAIVVVVALLVLLLALWYGGVLGPGPQTIINVEPPAVAPAPQTPREETPQPPAAPQDQQEGTGTTP